MSEPKEFSGVRSLRAKDGPRACEAANDTEPLCPKCSCGPMFQLFSADHSYRICEECGHEFIDSVFEVKRGRSDESE